jgi:hypothetical protein
MLKNTTDTASAIDILVRDASRVVSDCAVYAVTSVEQDADKYDSVYIKAPAWTYNLKVELPKDTRLCDATHILLDFVQSVESGIATTTSGNQRTISGRVTSLDNVFAVARVKLSTGEYVDTLAKLYTERVFNALHKRLTGGYVARTLPAPVLPEF